MSGSEAIGEDAVPAECSGEYFDACGDRDVENGGLPEDIPDNQKNGRTGLPRQISDDENAVICPAKQRGFSVHVR